MADVTMWFTGTISSWYGDKETARKRLRERNWSLQVPYEDPFLSLSVNVITRWGNCICGHHFLSLVCPPRLVPVRACSALLCSGWTSVVSRFSSSARVCRDQGAMASSLTSTLNVRGILGFLHNHSQLQLHSSCSFGGLPFFQSSCVARAASRRSLLVAAVGGPPHEPLVEDSTPSTSSSAEVRLCCQFVLSHSRGRVLRIWFWFWFWFWCARNVATGPRQGAGENNSVEEGLGGVRSCKYLYDSLIRVRVYEFWIGALQSGFIDYAWSNRGSWRKTSRLPQFW